MPTDFKYDVFLSHSAKDKPQVRELANRLKRDGLSVWFDEWEIQPGDKLSEKIERGLETSRVLVLCMSRNAFTTDWAALETGTFRFRDPANRERRFIPVRIDFTEIKDALKKFAYLDLLDPSDDNYAKLLVACRRPEPLDDSILRPEDIVGYTTLVGQSDIAMALAVTADSRYAIIGLANGKVALWQMSTAECIKRFSGHETPILSIAASPDGRKVVSMCDDGSVKVWDLESKRCVSSWQGFGEELHCIGNTSHGLCIFASHYTNNSIVLRDLDDGECIRKFIGHQDSVLSVAVSQGIAVSGSTDRTVGVWNVNSGECLGLLPGHTGAVLGVAIKADGRGAVSCSADTTVKLWDLEQHSCMATLEGHTALVREIAITPDGRWAVSASDDRTLRIWNLHVGVCVLVIGGISDVVLGLHISPDRRRIVFSDYKRQVSVLDLPEDLEELVARMDMTRYTNAKVLLVGDSGVGKTGLAYRLTENCFKESISTDGAWATQLKLPHSASPAGIEREIWLWDFAGQADYRLIHQLYMDETALAVLVFNPQSENPFEGLGQWDRDLQRAARRTFRKLLVAARCDRGGLMVSSKSVENFRQERKFADYIETSALRGTGCAQLRNAIIKHIAWKNIPWTASPRIFRLLKDEIVKLKDEAKVLLRMSELKQQLELRLPRERFTIQQLRAVVGLLASPGVVWLLEFGGFVLLQPERINAYAAAVIRSVRKHTEEIGCIAEEDVLAGRLDYQDMKRLPPDEEQIVLRAMHQTFVDHGLCLREHTEQGTLLIFPSYFKRERPELGDHPLVLVTYQFGGPLDEIYATLVVRLYHTAHFVKDRLWRFAADFRTHSGKLMGLKMTKKGEGTGEIDVYFEAGIADDVQVTFIRYIHEHLKMKAHEVRRVRHYVCPHCQTPVENPRAIEKRFSQGKTDILCGACERRVNLVDLIEEKFASDEFLRRVRELEEQAKRAIDNESRELILTGHAYAITGEAGQIYRQYTNSDHGIDGEIEFKDNEGNASGRRVYLQLKSGDSYLYHRKEDDKEVFSIKNERHADYWQQQAYPVMLVIRTSDGTIRWMDVSEYLKNESKGGKKVKRIVFKGEPFTALSVRRARDKFVSPFS
jgi:small GTP-binding protein